MSHPVIVGVDGTDTATKAAHRAARLAQGLDAELLVVSAYGPADAQRVNAEGKTFTYDHEQRAVEAAETVVAELRDAHPGLAMTARAAEGNPGEALVELATETQADVIVVGNKRVQSLARVLGTVAAEVTRKAPCDVYVAHTHP